MQLTHPKRNYDWRQVTYLYKQEYDYYGKYNFNRFWAAMKYKVFPCIKDLHRQKLINGVYVMNHAGLDIRLSANWEKHMWDIYQVLICHGIHGELKPWNTDTIAGNGDEDFNVPDVEQLIANTKVMFTIIERAGTLDSNLEGWIPRRPHLYHHWLYNQYGFRNMEEALVNWESFVHQSLIARQCDTITDDKDMLRLYKACKRRLRKWIWRIRVVRLKGFVRKLVPRRLRKTPTDTSDETTPRRGKYTG